MSDTVDDEGIPRWARQLFASVGITKGGDPDQVLERTGNLANHLAPNVRRTVRFILLFEGIAVLAPVFWLLVVRHRWSGAYVSYGVVVCTLLVIAICWWLRWRGMNQAWSRARMVAEIGRSAVATKGIAGNATVQALGGAPSLQPIAKWVVGESEKSRPVDEARDNYLEKRLDDQVAYYNSKLEEVKVQRRRVAKIVTVSLDGALFLAVAGLALSFNELAGQWLRLSRADYILGFFGAALPLVAILMQLLGSGLELDRRTGRYAQQIEFLEVERNQLKKVDDAEGLLQNVLDVERILLGEVVEWYYQVKNSEPYYRSKSDVEKEPAFRNAARLGGKRSGGRLLSRLGIGVGFMGRVVFGRLLVVALSVVITTGLISMHTPSDPMETSRLRLDDGRLLSHTKATEWLPIPERTGNGFLLIAHGLHDGVDTDGSFEKEEGEQHWMARLQEGIEKKLGSKTPDICLVNWHLAARPAMFMHGALEIGSDGPVNMDTIPKTAQGWLQSVAAIRGEAKLIGELVGFKIAKAIREGKLDRNQPMHFIGHSAGGFVVMYAATVLNDLGYAPDNLRVTMLDTPMPVKAHLVKLLENTPVDFYRTSLLAQRVPKSEFKPGFILFDIPVPEGIDSFTGAHSFAYNWFIDSIEGGDERGFARSPFAPGK